MPTYQLDFNIAADLANLSVVENAIENLLEQGLLPDSLFGNVMVACTEASLNAINHGSKSDPQKSVAVHFEIENDELIITIQDQGDGFDHEKLPDPTAPENLEKASGRGIFIIRNLCDEVEFAQNGSEIKLAFNLNVPVVAEA